MDEPPRMRWWGWGDPGHAPALGEHNEEVLEQLGFSAAEVDGLHASGVVPKAEERAAAE